LVSFTSRAAADRIAPLCEYFTEKLSKAQKFDILATPDVIIVNTSQKGMATKGCTWCLFTTKEKPVTSLKWRALPFGPARAGRQRPVS
jgi:hypothetical protein